MQQEKEAKITLLMRELEEAQDEQVKLKAHLEGVETEVRCLEDDLEQGVRAKKS